MWRSARLSLLFMPLSLALLASPALAQKIAVVTALTAAPLGKSQLAQVYLGRSFERRPIDLPEGNPLRAAFYRAAADSDLTQVRTAWARVMFTGRGEPPRELPNAAAVKKAVAADPRAIGYIDADSVDATVKTVLLLP
jgi:hypothetical protein